ncbi:methylmalonyl-CoA epimerase [Candidatus Bathyarchaeota archaeon]|nr:methylmalonyl-CoA epimerase [Candidatus Bathyarchaeota archaeon]
MLVGMDHIGIAVKDLDEAISVYRDTLGFKIEAVHVLKERQLKVAFVSVGGETRIELLEPLDRESSVAKFLETRGEGIHHTAVRVKGIDRMLEDLKAKGVRLVDEQPRTGAEGARIAFVHPKSTHGVLLELVEKP